MHRHQPTNPKPIENPVERIVIVCGPSSVIHRPRPSSTVHRPKVTLFPRKKVTSKQTFLCDQNLDTQSTDAIISSDTIPPPPGGRPRSRRSIT
jgi:hypothetical protein